MANQPTMDLLKAMRMSAMAQEFQRQLAESAYASLALRSVSPFWLTRSGTASSRISCSEISARFATPNAVVEEIEYHEDWHLDKAQILRFGKIGGKFIGANCQINSLPQWVLHA